MIGKSVRTEIEVDQDRLWDDLASLASFTTPDSGEGVTRRAWSREYFAAEDWLTTQMRQAGLDVEVDAARNIWGIWDEGVAPAAVVGSHIDSVPSGGRFDGCLGVLAGLEAIRALREAGHRPARQIRLVAWTEEEGSAFGNALFGSRAFTGELDLGAARGRTNSEGDTLEEVMRAAGHQWEDLTDLPSKLAEVASYLELHIEQGPVLGGQQVPIGIVTDIVGIEGGRFWFTGRANHAGGTPMEMRQDAVVGMARGVAEVRRLARAYDVRATTGQVSALPGASNVIAGGASFSVDARHQDAQRLADYVAEVQLACRVVADEEGLEMEYEHNYSLPPVPLSEDIQHLLQSVCTVADVRFMKMVSGAGHDAMVLAPRVPTGMLFVPSHRGISHAPDEYSSPEDCATGTKALAQALYRLSSEVGV